MFTTQKCVVLNCFRTASRTTNKAIIEIKESVLKYTFYFNKKKIQYLGTNGKISVIGGVKSYCVLLELFFDLIF